MPAPKTSLQDKSGFTLVELMVVISIIAILSVVGVTVFTGIQKNARDSRRKSDIDAIAKTLELLYSDTKGSYYISDTIENSRNKLKSSFASGQFPKDPLDGTYNCRKESSDKDINNCRYYMTTDPNLLTPHAYSAKDTFIIPDLSNWGLTSFNQWIFCANLENSKADGNKDIYCKRNTQ